MQGLLKNIYDKNIDFNQGGLLDHLMENWNLHAVKKSKRGNIDPITYDDQVSVFALLIESILKDRKEIIPELLANIEAMSNKLFALQQSITLDEGLAPQTMEKTVNIGEKIALLALVKHSLIGGITHTTPINQQRYQAVAEKMLVAKNGQLITSSIEKWADLDRPRKIQQLQDELIFWNYLPLKKDSSVTDIYDGVMDFLVKQAAKDQFTENDVHVTCEILHILQDDLEGLKKKYNNPDSEKELERVRSFQSKIFYRWSEINPVFRDRNYLMSYELTEFGERQALFAKEILLLYQFFKTGSVPRKRAIFRFMSLTSQLASVAIVVLELLLFISPLSLMAMPLWIVPGLLIVSLLFPAYVFSQGMINWLYNKKMNPYEAVAIIIFALAMACVASSFVFSAFLPGSILLSVGAILGLGSVVIKQVQIYKQSSQIMYEKFVQRELSLDQVEAVTGTHKALAEEKAAESLRSYLSPDVPLGANDDNARLLEEYSLAKMTPSEEEVKEAIELDLLPSCSQLLPDVLPGANGDNARLLEEYSLAKMTPSEEGVKEPIELDPLSSRFLA